MLKTGGATNSIMDKEDTLKKLKNVKNMFPSDWKLPNVYLFHGDISDTEMNYLYNHPKVKAMVSLTHGEGFGRPLLEATMTGLPVITTNWSGHIDFLSTNESVLLPGNLVKVPNSMVWKDIIIAESQWFNVDENSAYKALNYIHDNIKEAKNKSKSLMYTNRNKFTLKNMVTKLDDIMEKYLSNIPSEVKLNLPKLSKSKNSEPPKIKLPKLKKINKEGAIV